MGALRYYLPVGSEEEVKKLFAEMGTCPKIDAESLTGQPYVQDYNIEDPLKPTISAALDIPQIVHVTYEGEISCGFVRDGLYILGDASLMVKSNHHVDSSMDRSREWWTQTIFVKAPSLAQLREIYRQVRMGVLKVDPNHDWHGEAPYEHRLGPEEPSSEPDS